MKNSRNSFIRLNVAIFKSLVILFFIIFTVNSVSSVNPKKTTQIKKKVEAPFIITKVINHGFRIAIPSGDDKNPTRSDSLCPNYIFQFEVLNNSNLTITKIQFYGNIFLPNSNDTKARYSGMEPDYKKTDHGYIINNKENWEPKTKRIMTLFMKKYNFFEYEDFEHTPEYVTMLIRFYGGNIDKDFDNYVIDKINVVEDWKEYQRVLGLRK